MVSSSNSMMMIIAKRIKHHVPPLNTHPRHLNICHYLRKPIDCAIDLLISVSLPFSHIYNLSSPEKEAMEKYIKDYLAALITHPISSPFVDTFFFVYKKIKLYATELLFSVYITSLSRTKYPLSSIFSFQVC